MSSWLDRISVYHPSRLLSSPQFTLVDSPSDSAIVPSTASSPPLFAFGWKGGITGAYTLLDLSRRNRENEELLRTKLKKIARDEVRLLSLLPLAAQPDYLFAPQLQPYNKVSTRRQTRLGAVLAICLEQLVLDGRYGRSPWHHFYLRLYAHESPSHLDALSRWITSSFEGNYGEKTSSRSTGTMPLSGDGLASAGCDVVDNGAVVVRPIQNHVEVASSHGRLVLENVNTAEDIAASTFSGTVTAKLRLLPSSKIAPPCEGCGLGRSSPSTTPLVDFSSAASTVAGESATMSRSTEVELLQAQLAQALFEVKVLEKRERERKRDRKR